MNDLSEHEVSSFYSQAAKPELLDIPVDLNEPLSKQLGEGIVRHVVKSARLSVSGLRDPDEPEHSDGLSEDSRSRS